MKFSVFILKRLLLSILVLLGLSILIFIIARVVPGDPVRAALGARVPKEVVERMRHEMYLDKTLSEQYIYWVKGILSGNFGHSLVTKRLVLEDIRDYFPATAELAIVGGILTVTFSIFLGGISGQYKDTWVDNLIRILSYSGVGIPAFVVAIIFVLLFGYYWRIFPIMSRLSPGMIYPTKITGLLTVDSLIQGNFVIFWDALKHLILPSVSL